MTQDNNPPVGRVRGTLRPPKTKATSDRPIQAQQGTIAATKLVKQVIDYTMKH